MSTPFLDEVLEEIAKAPHSAQALTLYALVNTLEYSSAGCLFKLDKLRDLDARGRQLAYALMEAMTRDEPQTEQWQQARQKMDELIRQT